MTSQQVPHFHDTLDRQAKPAAILVTHCDLSTFATCASVGPVRLSFPRTSFSTITPARLQLVSHRKSYVKG